MNKNKKPHYGSLGTADIYDFEGIPPEQIFSLGTVGCDELAKHLKEFGNIGYSIKDVDTAKLKWQFRDKLSDGSTIIDSNN